MADSLLTISLLLNALEDPFAFALLVSLTTLLIGLWKREYALSFFLTITLTFAATHILKSIFAVSRPEDALAVARGYRFPSMHAAMSAAFIGSVTSYLTPRLPSLFNRSFLIGIAVFLVVFISWTRLYLNVHRPVDVIVGVIVGVLVSGCVHLLVRRYTQ